MNKFKAWTIRYEEKDGSDYYYAKVVAKSIVAAMDWCVNTIGIELEQINYVSSEEVAVAD